MDYQLLAFARALHVIAVVIWIGGVAFVTTVLIPAIRAKTSTEERLVLFESLEGKFSLQAKITTSITGITGLYMLYIMDVGFSMAWWIHPMLLIWSIFTLVIFVFEPLFLHRWFHQQALKNSEKMFVKLQLMHIILLSLSLVTIFIGVAGIHGLFY